MSKSIVVKSLLIINQQAQLPESCLIKIFIYHLINLMDSYTANDCYQKEYEIFHLLGFYKFAN